jgi:hypothetical protein
MAGSGAGKRPLPVFADTSVLVERVIGTDPSRREVIASVLTSDDYRLACAYSRLEYKRVVIQNLSLTLDYLCEEGLFSQALIRINKLQRQRRVHTLINIAAWLMSQPDRGSFDLVTERSSDELMAQKAIAILRVALKSAWRRFAHNIDTVVDALKCQRAQEQPREKAGGGYDTTVHESACRDRGCEVANFFRSQGSELKRVRRTIERLEGENRTRELEDILETIDLALPNASRLYDYQTCLKMADLWIHLECLRAGSKRFVTTNYRESRVLCPTLGLEWIDVYGRAKKLAGPSSPSPSATE